MNEYRYDDFDSVVDQNDTIIYDDVTQRTGGIIADLLNTVEDQDVELKRLRQRVAELESAQRWEPVEDGFIYTDDNVAWMPKICVGTDNIAVLDRHDDGVYVALPDNLRLCRLVAKNPGNFAG